MPVYRTKITIETTSEVTADDILAALLARPVKAEATVSVVKDWDHEAFRPEPEPVVAQDTESGDAWVMATMTPRTKPQGRKWIPCPECGKPSCPLGHYE